MAKQIINIGEEANDGTGHQARSRIVRRPEAGAPERLSKLR